jgi:hypothetical protein
LEPLGATAASQEGRSMPGTVPVVEIIMFFIMIIVLSTHANLHDECEYMLGMTCY